MKVFISYRRSDDRGGVGRLFDVLEARYGQGQVFVDVDSNMPLGTDFRSYIAAQVEGSDVVLAVIGPEWLRLIREKATDPKDFVRLEIEAALRRGIPVVPVLMGGKVPDKEDLPESIAQLAFLNGMIVDTGADFRHHAAKLCGKLDQSVSKLQTPASHYRRSTRQGNWSGSPLPFGLNFLGFVFPAVAISSLLSAIDVSLAVTGVFIDGRLANFYVLLGGEVGVIIACFFRQLGQRVTISAAIGGAMVTVFGVILNVNNRLIAPVHKFVDFLQPPQTPNNLGELISIGVGTGVGTGVLVGIAAFVGVLIGSRLSRRASPK